jgi:xanthine dehydrogenase iron-sulfur cluster and FAD-binding subunit A
MNQMTNSHILVHKFDYFQPTTVGDAVALLSQHGKAARLLAGGTDLIVQMKMERLAPECLIDIQKIPGLREIALQSDDLRIGAGTRIWDIANDPGVRASYTALAEACASFSTTQIQSMGTLGGNLCNGSPASDSAPPLIAFGADALIEGSSGQRKLPLEEFFIAPGETALRDGEMLVTVAIPRPGPGTGSAFLKVSRVHADIAKANAAAVLVRAGDRIEDCRLVFGSVAPRPMRARKAEMLLKGKAFDADRVAEAAQAAAEEVAPIDDVRSAAWYRRQVVKAMAHDALCVAWVRAAQQSAAGAGHHRKRRAATHRGPAPDPVSPLRVPATGQHPIELVVNGIRRRLSVAPNDLLLNVLRERLELTGTKYGCGIGECSTCTVELNGELVLSCLVLAISANGGEVITVEGLQGPNGELDALQEAFIAHAASQCGYCTPGMLMTAKRLLRDNASPTEDQVRDYLKGNVCRCTGYASIVRAVMSCAQTTPATEAGVA